eukprot:TRINITY_DN66363_c0_g1_i1.p1 TRINITY_DN66363_c0_g1~~TRINITY_DN66363_c0_g1_i1.p1  ORF type:complete len:371 (+),score=17.25 TRINITY_DN66363_c0_g1_i1:71-1183(+)
MVARTMRVLLLLSVAFASRTKLHFKHGHERSREHGGMLPASSAIKTGVSAQSPETLPNPIDFYTARSLSFLEMYGDFVVTGVYPARVLGRNPSSSGDPDSVRPRVLYPFPASTTHHALALEVDDPHKGKIWFMLETLGFRVRSSIALRDNKSGEDYMHVVRDSTVFKLTANTFRIMGPFASVSAIHEFYRTKLNLELMFRRCYDPDYMQVLGVAHLHGNLMPLLQAQSSSVQDAYSLRDFAGAIVFVSTRFEAFSNGRRMNPFLAFIANRFQRLHTGHWESFWQKKTWYNCHSQLAVVLDCLKHGGGGYLQQVEDDLRNDMVFSNSYSLHQAIKSSWVLVGEELVKIEKLESFTNQDLAKLDSVETFLGT